jgi:hypothetical protein
MKQSSSRIGTFHEPLTPVPFFILFEWIICLVWWSQMVLGFEAQIQPWPISFLLLDAYLFLDHLSWWSCRKVRVATIFRGWWLLLLLISRLSVVVRVLGCLVVGTCCTSIVPTEPVCTNPGFCITNGCLFVLKTFGYYIYRWLMALCKAKKLLLFLGEISYPEVSNGQSKLLNNFFMSKSCGILNFMIFWAF